MSGNPLVHNADLCADLGYHYRGNNARDGALKVIEAIDHHDAGAAAYLTAQRARIARFLPDNADLVGRYAALLDALFEHPAR